MNEIHSKRNKGRSPVKYIFIFLLPFILINSNNVFALELLEFTLLSQVAEKISNEGTASISSSKIQEFHGKEVIVRGFLFQTLDGNWILSETPNVKSCCAGSPSKATKQIFLEGNLSQNDINKAITLQGDFLIGIRRGQENTPLQYYHLSNAKKISNSRKRSPLIIVTVMALTTLAAVSYIKKNRRKNANAK
jgi:hypothetical protein